MTTPFEKAAAAVAGGADPQVEAAALVEAMTPEEIGRYEIIASCLTDDQEPSDPLPGDPAVVHAEYGAIDFEVAPGSPTPVPPSSARPVPAEPNFTG